MKGFRQLKWEDRIRLESLLLVESNKSKIARLMKVDRSTIYNELKRGEYVHLNSDYTEEKRYSPEIAQRKYDENLKVRGTQLKIGNDIALADYIERKIVEEQYSPDAVLGEIKNDRKKFRVMICTTTLYSYIDKGIFFRLTNKDLPVKKHKKRKYNTVKVQKRVRAGTGIEERPEEIFEREEFGHWEMDSVIGNKKSKSTLLVLTERKTRNEIIFKQPNKTAEEVVKSLNRLERRWGAELFSRVFKTITVDNGTEFSNFEGMEKSVLKEGKRTDIYYCHPYSSWERGTNETTNKLIRRHIPKGTSFDDKPEDEIQGIESWMNHYPRRILGYESAGTLFEKEIAQLLA